MVFVMVFVNFFVNVSLRFSSTSSLSFSLLCDLGQISITRLSNSSFSTVERFFTLVLYVFTVCTE